jgi:ATP-dependent helicase/nuclease subunit B
LLFIVAQSNRSRVAECRVLRARVGQRTAESRDNADVNESLIAALSDVCREHLLREKILIVPSLAIGHQIADAIAHNGTPWVNLRAETLRTLADAIAGFALAREERVVLSRAQALALIERACDEAIGETSYFAGLEDRPGLHRAIQRSIDDLRHAGLTPHSLAATAFEDSRKAEDLARILETYERLLEEGRFVDRFGVLARAVAMLERGAPRPWAGDALWFRLDETELTPLEDRFLRLATRGASTMLDTGAPAAPRMRFRRAAGEENELRGAFRSILDERVPFDDAEIVYTARDPYLALAYELAAQHGVPCTFAEGIASQFTRPGQAALHFLRWMGEGWQAIHLQQAARSGCLDFGRDAIGPRAFARLLRAAAVGWGRERHVERIDALIANKRAVLIEEEDLERRERVERSIAEALEGRKVSELVLALSSAAADGDLLEPGVAAAATRRFVAQFGAVRNEADGMASVALARMLEELEALPALPAQRAVVTSRLSEAVRRLHVAASNPRPGHLHVASIRAGGWSARSRLWIVGADERRHPGRGLQDPIVLDAERESLNRLELGQPLALLSDTPRKATEQFRHLLARSSSREVTLSFSMLDLQERREHFPAPAFLDAYRDAVGDSNVSYEDVERATPCDGFVDARTLGASEWWLQQRFGRRADLPASAWSETLLAAYPHLATGREAEEARSSDRLTKWDGRIEAPGLELDPRRNGRVYSASQLEMMASCPYRYFLARILHVEPLDDFVFSPERWLEAHEFGTLLHEVLQKVMTTLCASNEKPSLDALPRLQIIAEDALKTWRGLIPPPNEAAYERRHSELLQSLEIFLRSEEEACRDVTPRYFEVSFGFREDDAGSIAMPEPVRLELGPDAALDLRGRIDRVDHDEQRDEWLIWDYKSGATYDYDQGGTLQRGKKVQHAIYARALEQMLRRRGLSGRVVRSGYFFPTPKGRGARIDRVTREGELEHALNALFDVVARGTFPHAEEAACKWCEFQELCGGAGEAARRMDAKLAANANDPAVAAWMRLQGIR